MTRGSEHHPDDSASRRRVILVTPGFSASEKDWCIPILRDFAEGLARRNDVSIVALRYPGESGSYQVAGIDVVSLGGGDRKGFSKIGLMVQASATIAREARRRSADVIHAFWAHEPGAVACVAGRFAGVPVVVTLMGGELAALPEIDYGGGLASGNRILARFCLGNADRVVSLSGRLSAAAAPFVDSSRLCRLDFGVRTDRFRRNPEVSAESSVRPTRFLAVGALVPVKGHEVLLEAFARCRREVTASRLELVGEGPLRDVLETQASRLGLGSSIRFVGAVEHSDLIASFDRTDVLVVSSWWEGTPQVVHESLACGIPVVGTAVGVLPELTGAARCVPVGDAEALGREMARVAASAEVRRNMTAATAAAIRPIDDCVAEHEQLYDSIRRNLPPSWKDARTAEVSGSGRGEE